MTPTRELALQIFDELRKVGRRHVYSAGLLIGGKSVKEEQQFVNGAHCLSERAVPEARKMVKCLPLMSPLGCTNFMTETVPYYLRLARQKFVARAWSGPVWVADPPRVAACLYHVVGRDEHSCGNTGASAAAHGRDSRI